MAYNAFKKNIMNGGIDFDSDTIKVALVTSAFSPNQDALEEIADVTNEVSGTGYTADGATLASKPVTKNNSVDRRVFDAADVNFVNFDHYGAWRCRLQEHRYHRERSSDLLQGFHFRQDLIEWRVCNHLVSG